MKSKFQLLKCLGLQLLEQYSIQLVEYKHRYKSRRALLKLDDDMLNDIGISRQQAFEEGTKPFWKSGELEVRKGDKRRPNFQGQQKTHRVYRFLEKPHKSRGVSF